ncbi:imidazole glycerol phosphate synthase subunit HisH [Herbaspirillum huttiense]|uniref:imidazole glycerol phosphate synthase subunit HisH n=1 Tax=Herbaspirillum huttiense TaxID=863372 RepID=UPI0039AFC5B0
MITVVDYGVGNVGAIINMLDYLGIDARSSSDPKQIANADKLILPGVGAFDKAMLTLRERELIPYLNTAVLERNVPVLGVCLGMQLLGLSSEEGREAGLGFINARSVRINVSDTSNLKVPHIGWMEVSPTGNGRLFAPADTQERFYFDHSYHVVCDDQHAISATIPYGAQLACAVEHANIFGVQFHPEKSHRFGMRVLTSFAQI